MLASAIFWILSLLPSHASCQTTDIIAEINPRYAAVDPRTLALSSATGRFVAALKQPTGSEDLLQQRNVIKIAPEGEKNFLRFSTGSCAVSGLCSKKETQKVNFHTLYGNEHTKRAFSLGTQVYVGFSFRIMTGAVDKQTILVQAWQGAPHSPPFAMFIEPNYTTRSDEIVPLSFSVLNDQTGSNPSASRLVIGRAGVKLNNWYTVSIMLKPTASPVTGNTIEIGLVEGMKPVQRNVISYAGKWGYTPNNVGRCVYAGRCATAPPNPALDVKFGVYKPLDAHDVVVDFGTVRVTRKSEAANILQSCAR